MKYLFGKKRFGIIYALMLSCATSLYGQSAPRVEDYTTVIADGNSCELNSVHVDRLSNIAINDKKRIFVIARSGEAESELVNKKRLNYVKNFLQARKYWSGFDVLYTVSERSNGQGRIEFYLDGKLYLVMLAQRNKTPCMDCCDIPSFEPRELEPKSNKGKSRKININKGK